MLIRFVSVFLAAWLAAAIPFVLICTQTGLPLWVGLLYGFTGWLGLGGYWLAREVWNIRDDAAVAARRARNARAAAARTEPVAAEVPAEVPAEDRPLAAEAWALHAPAPVAAPIPLHAPAPRHAPGPSLIGIERYLAEQARAVPSPVARHAADRADAWPYAELVG
jgi:hypothetical protein